MVCWDLIILGAHAAVRFLPFCFMGGYDNIYTVVFTRAGLLQRSEGQKKSCLCDSLIQGDFGFP